MGLLGWAFWAKLRLPVGASSQPHTNTRVTAAYLALAILCMCLFTWTSSGRITYPDDEIVFQTTQSLVDDGDLSVEGIANRTGERIDRPTGTFGWAPGRDGQRYGFFGHGVSLAAVPAYLLGRASAPRVPKLWRYAIRSDLFPFHQRGHVSDWKRLVTNLSNCWITALAAVLLALWLQVLGHGPRAALLTALTYAVGTSAWPYSKTLLSEPLSTVVLLGAALEISRWHRRGPRAARHLWVAATLAGLSVHVHVLNLVAIPCLFAYALARPSPGSPLESPAGSESPGSESPVSSRLRSLVRGEERSWAIALALGCVGLALLASSQWWRFGSPFETGRFDHYGHWVWPFRGVATMLVAPGRSLLWYSPPLLVALWVWPRLRSRDRATASFIALLAVSRLLFVACRSDWHGGWAIGPRYLVPLVPFMLVPLAGWIEALASRPAWVRAGAASALAACAGAQAWLASHSVFQLFWRLNLEHGRERYMAVSDWQLRATPAFAFWLEQQPALEFWRAGQLEAARNTAKFDALAFGAWRLAAATEADGLWQILCGIGLVAVLTGLIFALALRGLRKRPSSVG